MSGDKTTFIDGRDTPMEPFDCSVAWNDKASGRFLHALVMHRGYFTDSYTFSRPPHGRNDTTLFRVWLPATRVEAFKADAQPQDFRQPPKIMLNSPSASGGDEARRSSPTDVTNVGCERCGGTGKWTWTDSVTLKPDSVPCRKCGGRGHA